MSTMTKNEHLNSLLKVLEQRLPGESETNRLNRVWSARVYIALTQSEVLQASKQHKETT